MRVYAVVWQVTMSDRCAAERACKDPNPIIDGRKTNVNLAYLGAKPRILPGRALPGLRQMMQYLVSTDFQRLFQYKYAASNKVLTVERNVLVTYDARMLFCVGLREQIKLYGPGETLSLVAM